jgi:hypothetical protein
MEVDHLMECPATLAELAERMNQLLPLTEQSAKTATGLAVAHAIVLEYDWHIQGGLSPDEALITTAKGSMQATRQR